MTSKGSCLMLLLSQWNCFTSTYALVKVVETNFETNEICSQIQTGLF